MKYVGLTLATLLLLAPFIVLASSAEPALNIEWQRHSGFDLSTGINGEWTITAHPTGNTTAYVTFYLDGKLASKDTQAPYSWTFNTDGYPEGEHTIRVEAHAADGETATVSEVRSFTGFPYIFVVGVLLFAGIVFAFALLATYHIIKQKAKAKRIAGKIVGVPEHSSQR